MINVGLSKYASAARETQLPSAQEINYGQNMQYKRFGDKI